MRDLGGVPAFGHRLWPPASLLVGSRRFLAETFCSKTVEFSESAIVSMTITSGAI
jgi:hypothetical protein